MGIGAIRTLRDIRTNLVRLRPETVSRATGLDLKALEELESGKRAASVWEAEALARVYAIDADVLVEEPLHVSPEEVAGALACDDPFQVAGDQAKVRILSAAGAARDIATLRTMLGQAPPSVPAIPEPTGERPYLRGARAAEAARDRLGLNDAPVRSMRDFITDELPGVALLYACLGAEGPAGITFAGAAFGPAIVLNLDGKNENPCVRRFSLAHELGHLLCDWNRGEPLASISGYMEENFRFEREQRTNAFAIRFLCPESRVHQLSYGDDLGSARILVTRWGLHYQAARLYLQNLRNAQLPSRHPLEIPTGREEWGPEERPLGVFDFPLSQVPPERRTVVARLAAEAYSRGMMQRDRFAEYLGITPDADLERVLDAFGIDLPDAA